MVEMFRNGSRANDGEIRGWKHPNYAGGDLQGVIEGLDHIRALGANAIWLSPIFAARTSHGYDVLNYYRVADQVAVPGDPEASTALFRKLVLAAHERGLKVVLDVPLNHASKAYELPQGDPQGLAPRATGPMQPAEKLWESWGGGYRYWNFDHAPTRTFLTGAALHWLTVEGVDGLRLDYVRGVPRDFWVSFREAVARAKPDAYLVGECWADEQGADGNAREIASYYAAGKGGERALDSLLDFPMRDTLVAVFARGEAPVQLEARLQKDAAAYGAGARPTYFLDNHDLARFGSWAADKDRVAAAVTYLATMTGPIVLFYGTETDLSSGAPKPGFTDAGRVPMPWAALDEPLVARVRAALRARADHPALRRGARWPLLAEGATLVVAKATPEEIALVAVNVSDAPAEVTFEIAGVAPAGATWRPIAGTAAGPAAGEDGRLRWRLPAKSTSVAVAGGL
jgi:glycosidase